MQSASCHFQFDDFGNILHHVDDLHLLVKLQAVLRIVSETDCLTAPQCFLKLLLIFHNSIYVLMSFAIVYYNTRIPKCSNRIFIPMRIKIIPPAISAFFWYLLPNIFPTTTPTMDSTKVVRPMIVIHSTIG